VTPLTRVTRALRDAERLSPGPRLVLIALADRADDKGASFPSVARLARDTGLCVRSVRGALRTLETHGLIETCRDGRRDGVDSSTYRVRLDEIGSNLRAFTPAPDAGVDDENGRAPRHQMPPHPGTVCRGTPAPDASPPRHGLPVTPAPRAAEDLHLRSPEEDPPNPPAGGEASEPREQNPDDLGEVPPPAPLELFPTEPKIDDVDRVWASYADAYRAAGNTHRVVLNDTRRALIRKRLKDHDAEQLCAAARGVFVDAWCVERRKWEPEWCWQNAGNVERFAALGAPHAGSLRTARHGATDDPDERERQRLGKAPRQPVRASTRFVPWAELDAVGRRLWRNQAEYEAACLPRSA
jgi:hypothetical protein